MQCLYELLSLNRKPCTQMLGVLLVQDASMPGRDWACLKTSANPAFFQSLTGFVYFGRTDFLSYGRRILKKHRFDPSPAEKLPLYQTAPKGIEPNSSYLPRPARSNYVPRKRALEITFLLKCEQLRIAIAPFSSASWQYQSTYQIVEKPF